MCLVGPTGGGKWSSYLLASGWWKGSSVINATSLRHPYFGCADSPRHIWCNLIRCGGHHKQCTLNNALFQRLIIYCMNTLPSLWNWVNIYILSPPLPICDVVMVPGLLPILHSCEIKSGSGLGTRLQNSSTWTCATRKGLQLVLLIGDSFLPLPTYAIIHMIK